VEIPPAFLSNRLYRARVSQIRDLTYDMKLFRFDLEDPPDFSFKPGQYVQLVKPAYPGSSQEISRGYSVASSAEEKNTLDLIIRRVPGGLCTAYCFDVLRAGDPVLFTGPYGEFGLSPAETPVVFIAGGSGMAPFISLLQQMQTQRLGRRTVFFFGAKEVRDLFLVEEIRALAGGLPECMFVPVVAMPEPAIAWKGETGLVTEALAHHFTSLSGWEAYLCGSPGMIDACLAVLQKLGVEKKDIFYDKF
jgi:Na+-transporting NADH:ubiquinone oxidoreductase subunit F